ncbi:hypothetical protein [Chryseobacterium jejuense]|uniref:hypothetical protein n=1 Tax=Chryseobacterium jejuense TaxID=445960 RepID=UPI001AE0EB45|nr:hypothetical protein [Chryseobacterium jejuense]MBP2616016.1 hypothetical protein [Chryseobacterium jejuense]
MNRILLIFLMISSFSCSQKTKSVSAENSNENKTFYFIDYDYNKKCGFEIYINDILVQRYTKPAEIANGITSINSCIISSGKQDVKVILYPFKNKENIESDADISLKVFYLDNYDKNKILTSSGQGKVIFDLSSAVIDKKNSKKWSYTGQFHISNMPYHVEGWSKSKSLKGIPGIEKKVRDKFAVLHKALDEKDTKQFMKQLAKSMKESKSFYYLTDKDQENSIKELEDLLSKPNIKSAPLDNTVVKFYANGHLASLETIDGEPALRIIQKQEGHKSEDVFPVMLFIPQNSDELEVIR